MREPAAVEPTLEIGNEGKAARRLELFETARGVESTNVAPKQRTRRSRGESAPPDAALAATYAEVATEIASPPAAPAPAPGGGLDPPTPNGTAQWRSIGPTDIPDGQTYGSGPGAASTCPGASPRSRSTPRTASTCSSARRAAACGRRGTAARPGRRARTSSRR